MDYNNVTPNDAAHKRLYERVKARLENGEHEQGRLVDLVATMVIRDKLVAPADMHFDVGDDNRELRISYGKDRETGYSVHKHALTQLAQKVSLPVIYSTFLKDTKEVWKPALLAHILEESYVKTTFPDRGGSPKFLHRIVGGELRGFLSRRFNRHVASAPLLRAFLECTSRMGAFPFDATASDVKLALKCMLPYVFEPIAGQFVCVGVEWANSDFGAGRMQVALSLWMPNGDRFTVLDHVISRVHIGSVIEESDIEISEETARKEAEAQASAIRDSVEGQLAPASIDRLLGAIATAHDQLIPWDKLKGQLSRFLAKKDVESLQKMLEEDSYDLPPVKHIQGGASVPTKWWACSALSWLANRTDDPEKKLELQHAAGSFLEVK